MIVSGSRDQSNCVDPTLVVEQAAVLNDTGKGKLVASDQEIFNRILSHDNFALLREVFQEYKKVSGRTIEEAVTAEIAGDLREAMLAIIESVYSGPAFFAKRLFLALDGILTSDDATIIRIIVSRSEIDLGLIKTEFERLYDRTLLSVVKNKTSGDFKHVLCRIIGD
jgi:annexin A7/11